MLRGLRKASSNWLGRIFMAIVLGLIAVVFTLWGVNDVFRNFGRSTVAKVGSTEITVEQFRQIYNDRLQQIGRQFGRPITPEQARALRLEEQLANQLVAEAALDQRARQLRLNLSDEEIARQIMADPNFKNAAGQFDPNRFALILRNAGYNETRFAAEQRRLTLRREVADTISADVTPPKSIADALNRYNNEQRAIDYVVLDRDKAGEIPAPTPEQVTAYFEERKAQFRAPEYRTVVVLSVTPADIAKAADVNDADAQKFYEANKGRYGSAEKRQVEQIPFPNAEEAAAAAARLQKSEITFAALATERGLTEKDIDLGLVTKSGLFDRAVGDAAFALAEGAVSAPVQGQFGTVLLHVSKIEPEQFKPFAEVAAEIKQAIAVDRARAEISARHDKIEDERAAGSKLTEIAPKLGLTARTIEIDRSGRDPAGQPVAGLPAGVDVLANAFSSDVGVENEPLQIAGGGYLWFEVAGVKRTRERNLEEVRPEVEQRWRDDQAAERLKARASALLDKVKTGTSFADAAAADGFNVRTTFGLKRAGNPATLAPKVIDAVFRTDNGAANSTEGASPTEWVVFQVTDISVPSFDSASADAKRAEDTMRRTLTEDLLSQYVLRLQADLGATINLNALRTANSPGDPNSN
ncbi:MAG: peptidyl-prolyl cis-trans isomerase [Hyphomicrobiales bacterium]|jgi:peptidyl-prolyl cis-trans isomerase D|nr:peptidyl-prolyl cis-trans isomerase [Hyphomicrobiales bacterium]